MRGQAGGQGTRRAASWHEVLERTLLAAAAFWLGVQALNPLVAIGGATSTAVPGLLVVGFGNLALCALCGYGVRRGLRPSLQRLGLAIGWLDVLGGGTLGWAGATGLTRAAEVTVPSNAVQAIQVFVIAAGVPVRTAIWTIIATGPVFLLLHLPAGVTGDTLEQWVVPTSSTIALAALVGYLRSGSAYAARLDAWNRAARSDAAATSVHTRALEAARRVIHDDVITALRGVAQRLPDSATLPACRNALSSLATRRECASREELLESLRAEADVEVLVDDQGWPVEPPARVLDALRGAAREALRNVFRHSGVDRAALVARTEGRTLLLEVSDEGRGLTTAGAAGFGIGHSIVQRMQEVDGEAAVRPGAATGTAVVLAWTPPPPPPAEQVTPYSSDQRWRGYLPVALAVTLNSLFLAVRNPGPHPVAALSLAALLACLVPIAALWFARHPSRTWDVVPVTVTTVALTWLGLSLAGPGALLDYRSWVVGLAAAIPMLYAFDAPFRLVLIPVLAEGALCIWLAAEDPTIGALEPLGAITTPLIGCGFSALFGALLRRGAHAIRQAEATRSARREEQAWASAQEVARRHHLATLQDQIAPFLQSLVQGYDAPDRVQRAELLAARCRDELHLPQPLSPGVRGVVDDARRHGVTINFRAGSDARPWPRSLERALEEVLGLGRLEVVTVLPEPDPRLVVLPALTARERRALERALGQDVAVHGDEVRTQVEVSTDRPTPQRDTSAVVMGG